MLAVKPRSPLAGVAREGDVLREIDGQPTRGRALDEITRQLWQLSRHARPKLIALEREAVVARPPTLPGGGPRALPPPKRPREPDAAVGKLRGVLKVHAARFAEAELVPALLARLRDLPGMEPFATTTEGGGLGFEGAGAGVAEAAVEQLLALVCALAAAHAGEVGARLWRAVAGAGAAPGAAPGSPRRGSGGGDAWRAELAALGGDELAPAAAVVSGAIGLVAAARGAGQRPAAAPAR